MSESGIPRAVADLAEGLILATVEVNAPAERVFDSLASKEITAWWVRPGVFDTREWTGDVRVGGSWQASGMGSGRLENFEPTTLHYHANRKGKTQPWQHH